MKNIALLAFVLITFVSIGHAQKLAKPTKTSTPLTAAQSATLQEGIVLHDAKKYNEAIAKYRSILLENPDNTLAMYEMSMTLSEQGEDEKAIELANIGSKYISDELPLFYVVMANIVDSHYKKPEAAIKIYQEGLKILKGDTKFAGYRSSLNYNLAITYFRQKKYNDSRTHLKAAVEDNNQYASPHFVLAIVYQGTRYKVPALFAASRLISLEYNTARSQKAASIITDVLKAPSKDPKSGNIQIILDADAPKDEGDFGSLDLMLSMMMVATDDDKAKNRSENERFIDALDSVFGLALSDKKLGSTFVGKNYFPFIAAMKKNDFMETFGYLTLFLSGNRDAGEWLQRNDAKVKKFLEWAKAY
jgi:hypothetical protein